MSEAELAEFVDRLDGIFGHGRIKGRDDRFMSKYQAQAIRMATEAIAQRDRDNLVAAQAEVDRLKGLLETLADAVDSQLTPNDSVLVWDYCDEDATRSALAPGK